MGNQGDPKKEIYRKPYAKPTLIKLTLEEAKRKLIDLASHGDELAEEMLVMMFPNEVKKLAHGRN